MHIYLLINTTTEQKQIIYLFTNGNTIFMIWRISTNQKRVWPSLSQQVETSSLSFCNATLHITWTDNSCITGLCLAAAKWWLSVEHLHKKNFYLQVEQSSITIITPTTPNCETDDSTVATHDKFLVLAIKNNVAKHFSIAPTLSHQQRTIIVFLPAEQTNVFIFIIHVYVLYYWF